MRKDVNVPIRVIKIKSSATLAPVLVCRIAQTKVKGMNMIGNGLLINEKAVFMMYKKPNL